LINFSTTCVQPLPARPPGGQQPNGIGTLLLIEPGNLLKQIIEQPQFAVWFGKFIYPIQQTIKPHVRNDLNCLLV